MLVATHPGNFHADDAFAIATLGLALGPFELVRTRDRARLAEVDVRVDVGGRSDPATGDFDHHQKGGAGERENGIRFASFGLVWREHGAQLAGGDEPAKAIDARLVQGVDANDTGQTISQALIGDVRPMTVSGLVATLNPNWDEELDQPAEDARFGEAVAFARTVIVRELEASAAYHRARQLVVEAIGRSADPRVVELDRGMPWKEAVVTLAPEALYVLYPKSEGWGIQAVPQELGAFANRKDLPEAWAGLNDEELAAVTGVQDAIFCHSGRFIASARSREDAQAMLALALA